MAKHPWSALFHKLWSTSVGQNGYVKDDWMQLEHMLLTSQVAHDREVARLNEDLARRSQRWHELERIQDRQMTVESLQMELAEALAELDRVRANGIASVDRRDAALAKANAQVEWYKRELDHENSVQARVTKERDSLRVEVERLRAAIGPTAAGLQVASYPCRYCDSSGCIEGTTSIGGTLPDLDCPKCLGTGRDFSPHHKIRRLKGALQGLSEAVEQYLGPQAKSTIGGSEYERIRGRLDLARANARVALEKS